MPRSILVLLALAVLCLTATAVHGVTVRGRVASLTGEPEKGVVVTAEADNGVAPIEAVTDASGAYTLQLPNNGAAYRVAVKTNDGAAESRVARATPEFTTITGSSDASNVNFLAFRRASKFDLTGEIVGLASTLSPADRARHLESLEVQVALASAPNTVVAKTPLLSKSVPYFEFLALPAETYILTIKSSLPTRTYSFSSPSLTITLASPVHVNPAVDIGFKLTAVNEMQASSLWNTVLLALAVLALMYKEKTLAIARGALKALQTRNPTHLRSAMAHTSTNASADEKSSASSRGSKKHSGGAKKAEKREHVSTFVRYDSLPSTTTEEPASPPSPAPAPVVREKLAAKVAEQPKKQKQPKQKQPAIAAPTPASPAPVVEQSKPKVAQKPAAASKPATAPATTVAASAVPTPAPKETKPAAAAPETKPAETGAKFCASCGHKRPTPTAKFCSECGDKF